MPAQSLPAEPPWKRSRGLAARHKGEGGKGLAATLPTGLRSMRGGRRVVSGLGDSPPNVIAGALEACPLGIQSPNEVKWPSRVKDPEGTNSARMMAWSMAGFGTIQNPETV